jgi:hypothetical protein
MDNVLRIVTALILALAPLAPARAASVLPVDLPDLIETSTTAFQGRVIGNRTERDAATGLVVTYTKFEVADVLKGAVGNIHEIKQLGGSLPGEALQYRVPGIPDFTVGQEYVVFLAGVSAAGFSSPIGLTQGRFNVNGKGSAKRVGNGADFRELTARMRERLPDVARANLAGAREKVREMDIDEFKQSVRNQLKTVAR